MIRVVLLVTLLVPMEVFGQGSQASQDEPSLVELARRERERRARTKKVPIITNASLRKMQRGHVGTGAAAPGPEGEEGEEDQEGSESGRNAGAAAWKSRFDEARMALSNAVNRSRVLNLNLTDLQNKWLREDDGGTQGLIQQQMTETAQLLETARQEAQRAREAIQQLQNEARAAGLFPGEIRDLTGELPEASSVGQ